MRLHDQDAELSLADVADFLRGAGLMVQKIPERLELVAEIPRTGLGKISKQALQKQFGRS